MSTLPPPPTPAPASPDVLPPGKKRCISCNEMKPVQAFYRMHKTGEARQSRCKVCDNLVRGVGMKRARGLMLAAGAAHQLDLQRERDLKDPGPRVCSAAVAKQRDGVREYGGQGGGSRAFGDHPVHTRAAAEQLEVERFSNEVAALVVGEKVPLAEACRRASLPMPAGEDEDPPVNLTTREKRASSMFDWMRPGLVTPAARLSEPPKSIEHMIPRERVVIDDEGFGLELVMLDEPETSGRGSSTHTTSRAAEGPKSRASTVPASTSPVEKREAMKAGSAKETVLEAVRKHGPMISRDVIEVTKLPDGNVTGALSALKKDGLLTKAEGWGGAWSVVEGGGQPSKATAGRAGGKARKAKAAKANGKSNGAPPTDSVSAALATLKAGLLGKTERLTKAIDAIDAIDVLGELLK